MESNNASGEIYHIGNPTEINMETLTTYVGELMGHRGEYEAAATYPGSVARRCPNISKAKDHFGFSPCVDWKTAVRLTADWYRDFFISGKQPESGGFEPPEAVLPEVDKR